MATVSKYKTAKGMRFKALQRSKLPSGKYITDWMKSSFLTREAAEEWMALKLGGRIIEEEARGPHKVGTLGDLIIKYKNLTNDSNGKTKAADLTFLLTWPISDCPLASLTSMKLVEHCQARLATGISPSTVNNDLIWIGGVIAVAPAFGMKGDSSIVDEAKKMAKMLKLVSKSASRDRIFKDGEEEIMMAHFKEWTASSIPMAEIVQFAIHSTRRLSEIMDIKWESLDAKHKTGWANLKSSNGKSKWREFKLTDKAWAVIQRQPKTSEFVFPYNPQTVGTYWSEATTIRGVDDFRFHDLRHEGITRLFREPEYKKKDYSIPEIMLITGHTSLGSLNRYINLRAKDVK